ncbi:phosphorylase [Sphingomonas sp. RT2P30]|uniref:phosphorylase family protein n=1 Tax=Parasphingomonas halimpatiens TaxID=3096162 RepID=UPI002FC7BC41
MTILVACGLTREARIIARPGLTVVAGGGDAARLEAALEAAAGGSTMLLSSGLAGALDPALKAGDVVVGSLFSHLPGTGRGTAREASGGGGEPQTLRAGQSPSTSFAGPPPRSGEVFFGWLASQLPEATVGTILATDSIIASAAEKRDLFARTGAIAVDMESHIAARVAARHGLPFAIVRTISDSADQALPPAALVGMKPDGSVALGAVLASLARHPAQLPALIATGRSAGRAFAALSRVYDVLGRGGIGGLDLGQLALDMA